MSLFDQYNWQGENGFPYYWGYYWLGPVQIPPLPFNPIGLTDTVTGQVYYLELDSTETHITLAVTPPTGKPLTIYAANDGPYVQALGIRMGITNGHVVLTQTPGDFGGGPFALNPGDNLTAAGFYPVTLIQGQTTQLGFTVDMILGGVFDPTP